jgi:hypothetical protein
MPAAAGPEHSYLVISETTSPDRRHAVAWTLSKAPESVNWDKFRSGDGDRDDLPDFEETGVQNNIIDVKSGRKLATLTSAYWELPDLARPNHEGMLVAWSPKSDYVVVLHQLRFENYSLDAVQIKDGAASGTLSFLKDLEKVVRGHLAKAYAKQYPRDKDAIVIGFGDLKPLGGGKFSLVAYSGAPKRINENILSDDSTITFELLPGKKGRLELRVLGIMKVVDPPADSDKAAQAVLAADKELTAAYQALRRRLDATARETLKQEQIEWLQKRDQITDDWQRSRFIETRASDLKKQAVR